MNAFRHIAAAIKHALMTDHENELANERDMFRDECAFYKFEGSIIRADRDNVLRHLAEVEAGVAGLQAELEAAEATGEFVKAEHARRVTDLIEANSRYQNEAREVRAAAKGGFQARVQPWLNACFGEAVAYDIDERNHRFLEEALELVQAHGCTASEAHQLVDYVFGRPIGEPVQEVGGVEVTLAALCSAAGIDKAEAAEIELTRCWSNVEKIRAKHNAKPKHSPLPGASQPVERGVA